MNKHQASARPVIIYSHGFGVGRDDRGLFTDIAERLTGYDHVLFDYNQMDDDGRSMVVAPLDQQAGRLAQTIMETAHSHPGAPLYMVAHSQGCLSLAMTELPVKLAGAVLLAPPSEVTFERMREIFGKRPETVITEHGTSRLYRTDDSITTVLPNYWKSLAGLHPIALYNQLGASSPTLIVHASQDEVLGNMDFSQLKSHVSQQAIRTGHNFENDGRRKAAELINSWFRHDPLPVNATDPQQEFAGTKGLVFIGGQILVYRRDAQAPKYPLALDVPGGGRENNEDPATTFIREVHEEFSLKLQLGDITYSRAYAASSGSGEIGYYMAAQLPASVQSSIAASGKGVNDILPGHEGRAYLLMDPHEFINRTDAWPAYQRRARDYLAARQSHASGAQGHAGETG